MKIFFIRHTQSEANVLNILAGQKDFKLTPHGTEDAKHIVKKFSKYFSIDRIISSTLSRAKATAEEFANHFGIKEIELDKDIMEQNVGVFSGKSYEELNKDISYIQDKSKRWDWKPKDGESYQEIAERVKRFFKKLESSVKPNENVLIVCHAVTLRLIYGYIKNMYPKYFEGTAKNGEIWEITSLKPGKQNYIKKYIFRRTKNSMA